MRSALIPLTCLVACGSPEDPSRGRHPVDPTTDGGPTALVPTTPPQLQALVPEDIEPWVDAVSVRCDEVDGYWVAETVGPADTLTIDLLGSSVTTLRGERETGDDVVWQRFAGPFPCEEEGATLVLRASREGVEVDCAVQGPGRDEVLAGQLDGALAAAGRPTSAGCHDISRR
ncbi:MAG: hypothetical protein KC621_12400 [Myxococcales bacterium]|nr:hypothetical protein [Myxococcales bacterium]